MKARPDLAKTSTRFAHVSDVVPSPDPTSAKMTTSQIPHVLVVEDDRSMRELMRDYLGANDLRVSAASSGDEMTRILSQSVVDLVILDLRLGREDGMQLARNLRATSEIPVIIVTGKGEEADRVMGLEIAADDYITKPFSNRELLARIRAVLRRYQLRAAPAERRTRRAYRFDGWEINLMTRRLHAPDGTRVELGNGEFNLLVALCEAPLRPLTRDQLLDASRLHGAEVYDRSIDVQILRLRRKIEKDPSSPRLIRTERGVGYYFDADVAILD